METEKKSRGALIGSIIIIILLIIGGLYVWQEKNKANRLLNEKIQAELGNLNAENINELDELEIELNNTDTLLDENLVNDIE